MTDAIEATRRYDRWLARQTRVVDKDLAIKHERMESSPFVFLRATYYLWVARWTATLPKLSNAPPVWSVGDLHMENFGTWRDAEGRLVWGINDFDEAHPMSFPNDLVRLAVSALLAADSPSHFKLKPGEICQQIANGYRAAIERGGEPFVLM